MREHQTARQKRLADEKTLYRYSAALENGDFDTIAVILHEAENDPNLEYMIIEMHQIADQQEEPLMNLGQQEIPLQNGTMSPVPGQHIQFFSRGIRQPRGRWFAALQGVAVVLIAIIGIVSANLIFLWGHPTPDPLIGSTTQQWRDIVVTAETNIVTNAQGRLEPQGRIVTRDAHTGVPLWSVKDDSVVKEMVGLVVQNHVIYEADYEQVRALRVSDGSVLWRTPLVSNGKSTEDNMHLITYQDLVYVSGYAGNRLYTLDAKTGKILWHVDAADSPLFTVNDGVAYIMGNNIIQALDGKNGHVLRTYNTHTEPFGATVANHILYVQTLPSFANDPQGIHKDQHALLAIDSATGKQLWSVIAPSDPGVIMVTQGVVVLFKGQFCGYSINDGKQQWCTSVPDDMFVGAGLASADGVIYGIHKSSTKTVLAIDARDGHLYWSKNLPDVETSPIFIEGKSLILPRSNLVLDRSNGNILWRFPSDIVRAGAVGN